MGFVKNPVKSIQPQKERVKTEARLNASLQYFVKL
jgi:hypothetical protein